jgi:hypothetical protein
MEMNELDKELKKCVPECEFLSLLGFSAKQVFVIQLVVDVALLCYDDA